MFLQPRRTSVALTSTLLLSSILAMQASTAHAESSNQQAELSKQLGWVTEPNQYNVCGGYYKELPINYVPNEKLSSQDDNYNLYANRTNYSFDGNSTLNGNVRVVRPTKEMTADSAELIRDPTTKKIVQINADGHATYLSEGMLMIGQHATLKTGTDKVTVNNMIYRHSSPAGTVTLTNPSTGQTEKHLYQLTARGQARFAEQVKPHIYYFKNASYTTCPPNSNVWKVTGSRVHLNYVTGWGRLINGFLFVKGMPVMYLPFYGFPLDKRRHTGFLTPSFGSASSDGSTFALPFYWNMAPNYDMLITPQIMSRRGVKTNVKFRYLTNRSVGSMGISVLPKDNEFSHFQRDASTTYGGQSNYSEQLNNLKDDSDTRKAITWNNQTAFNDRWSDNIVLNYASDDYYTQDFSDHFFSQNNGDNNNLLEKAQLNYQSTYWNWEALAKGYQTFHPVNASNIVNQYKRLPQLTLNANSPLLWGGLTTSFSSQYTYFTIIANPNQARPVFGSRLFAEPGISYDLEKPYGFLIPSIKLHAIGYELNNNLANTPAQEGRAVPIFSTHGKLIFARNINPFNYGLKQTLEPEFYYLYTPFVSQNELPNFDTDQAAFTYNSLFSYNRFSGVDRVGDANQVSLGVTSRFIDLNTGNQKAMVGVGEMYYFRNREVSACYGQSNKCKNAATDSVNRETFSPIAGELQYNFNPNWNITGNWAWNPTLRKTANEYVAFQYDRDNNHIVNISYNDINHAASGIGVTQNHISLDSSIPPYQELQQASISGSWPLTRRVQLLGSFERDFATSQGQRNELSYNTYNSFFYGAEYNSCCWAARLFGYQRYNGLNNSNHATFQHGIFLQIALIGLGTLGHSTDSSAGAGMLGDIAGYNDTFGQG